MALSIEHIIVTVTAKSPSGKSKRSKTFSANATKARHDFIADHVRKGWKVTAEFDTSAHVAAVAARKAARAQRKGN